MGVVVLSLIFIPFGKFFHVIQRPATVGVHMYKRTSQAREGIVAVRPLRGAARGSGLRAEPAGDDGRARAEYRDLVETCPRCKRLERGKAYLDHVKRGF